MPSRPVAILTQEQLNLVLNEAFAAGSKAALDAILNVGDMHGRSSVYTGPVPVELRDWIAGVRARYDQLEAGGFNVS